MPFSDRVRQLNSVEKNSLSQKNDCVVYWMSRDQRTQDNWTLYAAQQYSAKYHVPLVVVFSLVPAFLGAPARHYRFMLDGLQEVEANLQKMGIQFFLLWGEPSPPMALLKFAQKENAQAIFTDFSPLKIGRKWRDTLAEQNTIPVYEVDAHNIVPCWIASDHEEFAARTLRPKIHKLLPEFLQPFPPEVPKYVRWEKPFQETNWDAAWKKLEPDSTVKPVNWLQSGETAAQKALKDFLQHRLPTYHEKKNDPTLDGTSKLSPYLHFGQLSAQRIALEVQKSYAPKESKDAYLEELIVRRELAENYCFFNEDYDNFDGAKDWARKTLEKHRDDAREYAYSRASFQHAKTHDPLWNAAQQEMVKTGRMHGYMRMYWAKKILEWSESPEEAIATAVFLNDRYQLDGRDPNGYVGVMWSICGIHDRPWFERPVFGSIRYMNAAGCQRKFDVDAYITHVSHL